MKITVIRHSLSEANNRDNKGTPAFGAPAAPLMPEGQEMARKLGDELRTGYGIDPACTIVAVSQLRRTRETAAYAGFGEIATYPVLNEVDKDDIDYPTMKEGLLRGEVPQVVLDQAQQVLDRPPAERVWVTHGLVIVGLTRLLGVQDRYARLLPRFCEIRLLEI